MQRPRQGLLDLSTGSGGHGLDEHADHRAVSYEGPAAGLLLGELVKDLGGF